MKQTTSHKKRVGAHHKQTSRYKKVYWPYIPVILINVVTAFALIAHPPHINGSILGYTVDAGNGTLLELTNQQRRQSGTRSLDLNNQLNKAAQAKADSMAASDYWAHTTPDGKEPWYFIDQAGYHYQKAGENLAYGFASTKDVIGGWMNSESHRRNLLDDNFSEVGFGIANAPNYQGSPEETIIVALYGLPITGAATATPVLSTGNKQNINIAELVTPGHTPYLTLSIGIVAGASLMLLLSHHALRLRRALRSGEKFVFSHPAFDLGVMSLLILCFTLTRGAGSIF